MIARDSLGMSSYSHAIKRNGAFSEEDKASTRKNEMFATGEEAIRPDFTGGRVKKDMNAEEGSEAKVLQGDAFRLLKENQNLKNQVRSESERAEKAEIEVGNLKGAVSKLESEKEAAFLVCQKSQERISSLEAEISRVQEEYKKLNDGMQSEFMKLNNIEDRCLLLEKEKQSLQIELDTLKQTTKNQQEELDIKLGELEKLNASIEDEHRKFMQAEEARLSLEKMHSQCQEEARLLVLEIQSGVEKLKNVEQCKVALDEELHRLKDENGCLTEQLEKLNASIEDKNQRFMQAEAARLSLEKLHSQSKEEARILVLEIQSGVEKLKNVEQSKMALQEELLRLKEENGCLNEQAAASSLKIINLENEIRSLKESNRKLEDESSLRLEKIEVLEQELCSLREDKKNLEQRHHELTCQINVVNLNVESLQASIKELRDGNLELKEIRMKHEDERLIHLDNLRYIENIAGKNAVLENSLSDANIELEGLREKMKTLEESCDSLHGNILMHVSEKAVLVSQLGTISENMEKLSEKNSILENSLSDVNVELEGLRESLRVLEDSFQSLNDEKSNLLTANSSLVSQVKSIHGNLENLERRCADLADKNLHLEGEKELILNEVTELQNFLKLEKEEHDTLMSCSKSRLANFEKQVAVLQEKCRLQDVELDLEQHKIMNAQIEIFILQRCLFDVKQANLFLSDKCQEYLETSRCKEKLISEFEQDNFRQKSELASLSQYNEKVIGGIYLMAKALNISTDCSSPDSLLELILQQIRYLQTSISDAQDDNQQQILETSVILALLEQVGLEVADLKSENVILERESKVKYEELSEMQSEKCELLGINEQQRQDVQVCNQREETLKTEKEILYQQLSDLQVARTTLESQVNQLLDENQIFSKNLYDLREKKDSLEEANSIILAESLTLENLNLIFRNYGSERTLELQLLSKDVDYLCGIRNELEQDIGLLTEKVGALEIENVILKESLVDLGECRRRLVILEDDVSTSKKVCGRLKMQIKAGHDLLVERELELLEANQKMEATEDRNTELSSKLEGLMLDTNGDKVVKEELQEKVRYLTEVNVRMGNEIACLHQSIDTSNGELAKLHQEAEALRSRENHVISELQKATDEVESCEIEIAKLLNEIQISIIHAATFEEKVLELLLRCESLEISAMLQREKLYDEITLRYALEDELKGRLDAQIGVTRGLEKDLSAYLLLVLSLWDDVASLEEHTLSLIKLHPLSDQGSKPLMTVQHSKSYQEQREDPCAMAPAGIPKLQELHAKVNALQNVVIDTRNHLEQERFVSNTRSEATIRENEGLKSKESAGQEKELMSKDIVLHLIKSEEPDKLQKGDAEIPRENAEQMMKDIQLDHILSPQYEDGASSLAPSMVVCAQTNDHMLELWETEQDCDKVQKISRAPPEHDIECHQIEVVEEEKNECPSKLVSENDLSIDKLELPNIITKSHLAQSGSVSERLSSDAQRLSVLQKSVKELKRNMETSELSNSPTRSEFDTVKQQLKEAEAAILKLIDINSKLTKKAEDFSASSSERKISERAKRGSDKIGRLELELQKIQYIMLKLKEEHDNKKLRAAERRTRVLLKDYLYGKRDSPRRKKVHCCACIRPRTKDE